MDRGFLVGAAPPTVLYRFFCETSLFFYHGLQICMWFGYIPHIIFVTLSQVELIHFSSIFYNNVNGQGIPCGRNSSYRCFTNSSETSLVFWSWSEDMHVVWI